MNRLWPWETKRLGPHHWVNRPWRPHEDPRVRAVAATITGSAVVIGVWQLQGTESSTAAHGSAAGFAAGLVVWGWRAWRR